MDISFLIENSKYLIVFVPVTMTFIYVYIFFSKKSKGNDKTRGLSTVKRVASSAECEAIYLLHKVQVKNKSVFKIEGFFTSMEIQIENTKSIQYFIDGFYVILPHDAISILNSYKKYTADICVVNGIAHVLGINDVWHIDVSTQGVRNALFNRSGLNSNTNITVHKVRPALFHEDLMLGKDKQDDVQSAYFLFFAVSLICILPSLEYELIYLSFIPMLLLIIIAVMHIKLSAKASPQGLKYLDHNKHIISYASGVVSGIGAVEDKRQAVWFTTGDVKDSQKLYLVNNYTTNAIKVGQYIEFQYNAAVYPLRSQIIKIDKCFSASQIFKVKPFTNNIMMNLTLCCLVPAAIVDTVYVINEVFGGERLNIIYCVLYITLMAILIYTINKVWQNYKKIKRLQRGGYKY
ncbi:MAG: hypothetical protein COA76_04420 [Moritella sp.]|uniref:hypothetical protein n=1 Tax=Moritella sp. TaxID=78556 RepID=UPI000C0F4ADC|nr:hypothetical protein [Moritella sp.]MBL1418684.1 hypothetical protein [Moritella sp.]PHR89392.1 MAG: hypothetical protein COA76_04420 [Moritella sp.]